MAKKLLTVVTSLVLAVSMLLAPVNVDNSFAASQRADDRTLVVAGSDFQLSSGFDNDAARKRIMENILDQMADDGLTNPDQYLFVGDYDKGEPVSADVSNHGIDLVNEVFREYSPGIDDDHIALSSGNHEKKQTDEINFDPTGAYEYDDYIVYQINEYDFPSGYNWQLHGLTQKTYSERVKNTATDLMNYLNKLIAKGDTRPIFVMTHVPLHVTNRWGDFGDAYSASYIFNVLNQAGAAGLNIVFLYGHVHNGEGEDYHGGAAVMLKKGDLIHIPQENSGSKYDERILNFTSMNAGYTGYFATSTSVDSELTMTSYLIGDTSLEIARYDQQGIHNVKSAGVKGSSVPSGYIDTKVYPSTQTINLTTVNPNMLIKDVYTDNLDGVTQEDLGYDVMKVALDQTELNLRTETEVQLTATVKPSTALNKNVTWSSSDPEVASVTQDGLVKSLKEGSATITVTTEDGGFTADCQVIVKNIALEGLTLDRSELTTFVGKKVSLNVSYTPENTTYPEVVWSSSDENIVTVDQNGNTEGKALGTATITVRSEADATIFAKCDVTVAKTTVNAIKLDKTQLSLKKGDSGKITASVVPADATNVGIIWSSSDENVATVDQDGNVTAVNSGDAVITATSEEGSVSATCQLKVLSSDVYITKLRFEVHDLYMPKNGKYTFHPTYEPWYAINDIDFGCYYGGSFEGATFTAQNTTDGKVHVYSAHNSWGSDTRDECNIHIVSDNSSVDWSVADGELTVNGGRLSFASANDSPWGKNKITDNITSITVGDKVTDIGPNAFAGCSNVTDITIPGTVKNIDESAFTGCGDGATITAHEGTAAADFNYGASIKLVIDPHQLDASNTCVICGKEVKSGEGEDPVDPDNPGEEPVHTHTIVVDEAVEATCTEPGKTEGKHCSECGEVIEAQETIEAFGHKEVVIPGKDATCTETGLTDGKKCETCGEVIDAQKPINALGHKEVVVKGKAATCTETGLTDGKKCETCGQVIEEQKPIDALGHKEVVIPGKDATCTETGLTEGKKCEVCGEILVAQEEIPALGEPEHEHTIVVDEAVEATCTEPGKTEGKHCSECGEVIEAQEEIPALGHKEVILEAKPATSTETGLTEGKMCEVCGEILVEQEEIPALGEAPHEHTIIVDEVVEATCTEPGKTEGSHCEVCGEILVAQEEIPALGHKVEVIEGKPATSTETGLTEGKKCSVCGEILVAQEEIPALGESGEPSAHEHTIVIDPAVDPTFTEPGKTEGSHCSECGEVIIAQEEIPMLVDPTVADKPSISDEEDALGSLKSEEGISGTVYYKLRARITANAKTSQTISWSKVSGATGYIIYGNNCGASYKYKKLKTITSGSTLSWKKTDLSKGKSYKYVVFAVRNGKVIAKSKTIHAYTVGGKYTNVKTVKSKKSKVTLKKGKKYAVKAKGTKWERKKKFSNHRAIKYESTNTKIAKVSSGGTITAVSSGKCYVYAYAADGRYKTITVTVK